MTLNEIAEKNGIVIKDCEHLWSIKSDCKYYVVSDKNTGKGNLIGVGTQDEICFKGLCNYHFKNGILCVNYNKSSKENLSEGDLLNEYAAIDTKTGRIIVQGENLYTTNYSVKANIEYFLFGEDDFIESYLELGVEAFNLAPKFIKKAKKIIKAVLSNCVENWDKIQYLYNPFSHKCEYVSFNDIEECRLYIETVLHKLRSKTHEIETLVPFTVEDVKDRLNSLK